jgi:arabinose-5-phosphate isomerase
VVGVTDDDGYLTGIITDGDLRRHMTGLLDMTAGHVMTANPSTVAPDTLAAEAIGVMEGKITCLFVVGDDARAQGILHIHDCLRAGVV